MELPEITPTDHKSSTGICYMIQGQRHLSSIFCSNMYSMFYYESIYEVPLSFTVLEHGFQLMWLMMKQLLKYVKNKPILLYQVYKKQYTTRLCLQATVKISRPVLQLLVNALIFLMTLY